MHSLCALALCPAVLQVQYRSHPTLMDFINEQFHNRCDALPVSAVLKLLKHYIAMNSKHYSSSHCCRLTLDAKPSQLVVCWC